jgi:voltage-gated potassium channel
MKAQLHAILFRTEDTRTARWVQNGIMLLIAASVTAIIVESMSITTPIGRAILAWFEIFTVAAFTVEYALRLWTCTCDPRFAQPIKGRLRYAMTPMAIIDFLAISPFYVRFFGLGEVSHFIVLRMLRLLRVLKMARYLQAEDLLVAVFRRVRTQLAVTLYFMGIMLIISATLMYAAEREAQPEAFGSIPHALWWALITFTTVGYGDVYPITAIGKILTAFTVLLAIGTVALPTGIISGGVLEELNRRRREAETEPKRCPHCGKEIDSK